MNCGDYQQDILMMIHGELGFAAKVRVKAHLSRCADCRKTRDTLAVTSHMIGAAIRSPGMSPWTPTTDFRQRRIPYGRTITGLVILLAAGALLTAALYHGGNHPKSKVLPAAMTSKCATCTAPNPVVDKCR
jgi:predicted anti-sigma-YlaC factor YlaD